MKKKSYGKWKRCLAAGLAFSLMVQGLGSVQVSAEEENKEIYLPAAVMPEEVETADTFYVGTTSGELAEESRSPYLLKIGRGGTGLTEASVSLKISDATAKYGKDYIIRLHAGKQTEAESPEGNQSLLDMISQQEVAEDIQLDEEEQQKARQENLDSLQQGVEEEKSQGEASVEEENYVNNPLAQAKETLTGVSSDREPVTSTQQSMVDVLSDTGNYLTQMAPGATLKVDFGIGEKVKYVELIPIDNDQSDGDRIFYVTLSEPSEGMTNSSVSESMFTIKDDEPREDAAVSFTKTEFLAEAGSGFVEVELERTGAMTQTVSVHMTSEAGTAVSGREFAPVDADVLFPFGITSRKLKITVDSSYLKEDADFVLKLTDGSGAKAAENSHAKVVVRADRKKASKDIKASEEQKGAPSARASLSDTVYGDYIDLKRAASKVRGSGGFGVNNDGPKGRIYMRTDDNMTDAAVSLSGDKNRSPKMYIYDGVRFSWRKYSNKPSWSEANVSYYRENQSTDARVYHSTGDKPRFGWQEREIRFAETNAARVKFYSKTWSGKKATLDIDWVKPILRPFKVELAAADSLEYYAGGNKVKNSAAVASNLRDSAGGYAVKYDGNKMVIEQKDTRGVSQLSGVEIVNTIKNKSGSKRIDSRFLNGFKIGDRTIQVSLNNDFCTAYQDYIGYEGNGGESLRGKIKLKPIYSYVDCKLRIERNTEKTAGNKLVDCKVLINGKEMGYGKTVTYHAGDKLVLSSTVSGSDYTVNGVELSFLNLATKRREQNVYAFQKGTYNLYLQAEEYQIIPMYTENDNRITVQVSQKDAGNFKATGIFEPSFLKKYGKLENGYYKIEVVGTKDLKNQAGASFTLAAEAKNGYIPIWQETNSSKYFMGTTFDYTAKPRRTANVISLYAGKESSRYSTIKGTLYYKNDVLSLDAPAGQPILPAEGGYLSAAGQYAMADAAGNVQTAAFLLPDSITKEGKTVSLATDANPVHVRVLAGATGATEYKDIRLSHAGTKVQAEDAGGKKRSAFQTDISDITIGTNLGDDTRFEGAEVVNVLTTDMGSVWMNDGMSTLSASVSEKNGEKVKDVEFLVLDRQTHEIKHTIRASKSLGSVWKGTYVFKSDGSEHTLYQEGDRIFVQMTTDKKASVLNNVDEKGNPITSDQNLTEDAKKILNQTTYAPVNTGFTIVKSGIPEEVPAQTLDIGAVNGLSGIPMVNNFNTNLNLGPINLTVDNLYDDQKNVCGQRLKVAIGLDFEQTSFKSPNYDLSDDGMDYGVSPMTLLKDVGKVKDSYKAAASNIAGAKNLGKTGLASMGASKWGVYPSIGFYLDFAIAYKQDSVSGVSDSQFVLQGGGIYLGASADYSVAWYALIPVVYIPCYFGVAGDLSLSLQAGASTTVEHTEEQVEIGDFMANSHNLTETLDFDFQFSAAGQIQVYCGVGICGTLGVRGGMEIGADFLWYPTLHNQYPYFDQTGIHAQVGFKMWVDLLLFTIPIPVYTIADKNFGLLQQYEDLKDKNEDELDSIIGNSKKQAKSSEFEFGAPVKEESQITYLLKERGNDPKWSGQMQAGGASSRASFEEKYTHTILSGGYDRPDSQMLDLGSYGTLLVFLQDDKTRTDQERTALSYSVYQNGAYSDPVIIQKDGTADYQPSVTDAGDHVIITWISSDPSSSKGDVNGSEYQTRYLKNQEVYVVSIPKTDLAACREVNQDAIVRLTNDTFYDSEPVAVYDAASGNYNVYYVKTAEDQEETGTVEATDLANPMNTSGKTYSVIAYRIFDQKEGWVVDTYLPNEKPSNVTEEAYKEQLRQLGGQRILTSPIKAEDVNMEDPLISDFTAIGYHGIAAFAYTVDKDNSADTDEDRDLFLQLYDFETRSTYKPIRLTQDDLADTMPQFARQGGEEEGITYLFWKSGDTLSYMDVSSLVKYGIDKDGNILPSVQDGEPDTGDGSEGSDEDILEGMTEEEIAKATYSFQIHTVDAYGADENQYASYSQYQVAADAEENLYVIWVDNGKNEEGQTSASQEIFAAAMIESEAAGSTEGEETMKGWSEPNQLTNFGKYCDEPALAMTKDGKMLMAYNKYEIVEKDAKPAPANMELTSSILEPCGSVEAVEISVSDHTPMAGEYVDVEVTFKNTGLTVAKDGFTAEIYEKSKDGTVTLLETYQHKDGVIATGTVCETFRYQANDKTPGSVIEIAVTETSQPGTKTGSSEEFVSQAEYEIVQNDAYQGADSKFYSQIMVTNTGNQASGIGDELQVEFAGPYGNASAYGIGDSILAKQELSLNPGETKSVILELKLPAKAFSYYGKVNVEAKVVDKEGDSYHDALEDMIYLSQPAQLTLNGNKNLTLKKGESKPLSFQYVTSQQLGAITPSYVSDDESVVRIEKGKLVAVGAGSAVVYAYANPYHTAASIQVTVKDTAPTLKLAKAKIKGMVSDTKKQVTISWDKVKQAGGYEVTYAANKSFTKNKITKKTSKTSLTLKKLSEKKTYYVKVRAYAKQGSQTVRGSYSKVRFVKVSPRPGKPAKATVKPARGKLRVIVAPVKKATGYEMVVSKDKKGKKVVAQKKNKKGKASFIKLKKKKSYYVTVRAYKKTKDGGYIYSAKKVIKAKTK